MWVKIGDCIARYWGLTVVWVGMLCLVAITLAGGPPEWLHGWRMWTAMWFWGAITLAAWWQVMSCGRLPRADSCRGSRPQGRHRLAIYRVLRMRSKLDFTSPATTLSDCQMLSADSDIAFFRGSKSSPSLSSFS